MTHSNQPSIVAITDSYSLVLWKLQVTVLSSCTLVHVSLIWFLKQHLWPNLCFQNFVPFFKECTKRVSFMNQFSWKESHILLGISCSWLSQTRSLFWFLWEFYESLEGLSCSFLCCMDAESLGKEPYHLILDDNPSLAYSFKKGKQW